MRRHYARMYGHNFHTILRMVEAILRKSAGYETIQSITMSFADEGMHYLYSLSVMSHEFPVEKHKVGGRKKWQLISSLNPEHHYE